MKKVLAVVLAAAFVGVVSFSANAQVPNASVYFDFGTYAQQQANCPNAPVGTEVGQLYVVLNNVNSLISAVEFRVSYPATSMLWLSDNPSAPLDIGVSPTGLAMSWNIPQNAFGPLMVLEANFIWMCDTCIGGQSLVTVLPHGQTGFLRAVGWPNNNLINLVGGTSLVCTVVSVEEQTWGAIKSLYND